jgi:hypothetical protein
MASTDQTLPFVIEQTTGAKIKVTLSDHDAPMGAARKSALFALGGKNEKHLVRLDGRQSPIIHTKYTVWKPNVIKGHLRDHFTGDDGHGQDVVKQLQDILDAQQPVTLTCGPWTWSAFPDEFDLPVEGLNDFTYELRFDVLSRPGQKQQQPDDDNILPFPTDLTAQAQAALAEQKALMMAAAISVSIQAALTVGFASVDSALTAAISACSAFENADLPALAQATAMAASAAQVSASCDELYSEIALLDPTGGALTTTTDDQVALFQAQAFATLAELDACKSSMWSVQYTANKRIRAVSKWYVVKQGDTVDSIARDQLGSSARASDLQLQQKDLVPNRKIRIPRQ